MNKIQIRISYADTDQMGVVYYGNYLTFFERGRTEFFRQVGISYKDIEAQGFVFPVIYAECNYFAPAQYDDIIDIETKLTEITAASITCSYEIKCEGKLLVKGKTKHPFVSKATLKPVRFVKEIKEILEKNIEK